MFGDLLSNLRFRRTAFGVLVRCCVCVLAAAVAAADEEKDDTGDAEELSLVEELVVLGDTALERDDPATFTDLDREEISRRNRGQDMGMLLADTPNAFAYSDAGNGVGYSYLSLRGFDQRRISVKINGVPLNTPESHQVYYLDLADFAGSLDRIQVQRGTGTALYGSPAVGGVVNFDVGDLGTAAGGSVSVGVGSFGTDRFSFRYGDSIGSGRWAYMVRAARVTSEGYRDHAWTRHELVHLALQRTGPDSIWKIHLFGGPEETQLAYFGVPASFLDDEDLRRTNFLVPGETDTFLQPHLQVINQRRLAPDLFLENTWYTILGEGFFRQFSAEQAYDPLGGAPPTPEYPELLLADAWRKRWIRNRQFGWIPRLSWNHTGGTLTAGMEVLVHTGHHRGTVQQGSVCEPDCGTQTPLSSRLTLYDYRNHKNTYTVFARETIRPSPTLAINVELQGTVHDFRMRDDSVRGLSYDASYSFLTPRLGVNWNFTDRHNLYVQASTARSEPTFSNVWNPQDVFVDPSTLFAGFDPASNRYFDPYARPEKLRSYEAGVGFAGTNVRWKANLYHMDFRDEFVFAGGIDEDGVPLTTNAARSVHQGIELEMSGRLPGEVDVGGHAALSRDELEDHQVLSQTAPGNVSVIDYSGNRVPLFPDHLVRLRVSRTFGIARVELGARRVGTLYTDASEDERKNPAVRALAGYDTKKIDPYTLVDFNARFDLSRLARGSDRSLSLVVHIDNLLDGKYAGMGYSWPLNAEYTEFYTEFLPLATRSVFVGLDLGF